MSAVAAIAAGVFVMVMVGSHPQGLRAPAWIGYAAGCAFILAGLTLVAGALRAPALQRWLGFAVAISLFTVSLWVAFGPGDRACALSMSFIQSVAPDAICRGAFGLGAVLVGLLIVVMLRRMLQARA